MGMITSETFEKAIIFAVEAHKGQVRKGNGKPYILHPISVMSNISSIKKSVNVWLLGAAAILHDTVEDCGVSVEDIAKNFGYQVASLVDELTNDEMAVGELGNKKEYLTVKMMGMSSYALAIKLCDRLDNVTDMEGMPEKFQRKYVQETLHILDKLKKGRKLSKTHKKLIRLINKELAKYPQNIFL